MASQLLATAELLFDSSLYMELSDGLTNQNAVCTDGPEWRLHTQQYGGFIQKENKRDKKEKRKKLQRGIEGEDIQKGCDIEERKKKS